MPSRRLQRVGLVATHQDWEYTNPVLALDEAGFEIDTGVAKLGDDVTPWNDLLPLPSESFLGNPPWVSYIDYVSSGAPIGSGSSNYADWSDTDQGDPWFGGDPFTSMAGTEITMLLDATVIIHLECALSISTAAVGNVLWQFYGTATDEPFIQWNRCQVYADIRPTTFSSGGFVYETLTLPPVRLPAGATLKLNMRVELSAGTASFASNRMILTRVA